MRTPSTSKMRILGCKLFNGWGGFLGFIIFRCTKKQPARHHAARSAPSAVGAPRDQRIECRWIRRGPSSGEEVFRQTSGAERLRVLRVKGSFYGDLISSFTVPGDFDVRGGRGTTRDVMMQNRVQFLPTDGFAEIAVHPGGQASLTIAPHGVRCQGDDRLVAVPAFLILPNDRGGFHS